MQDIKQILHQYWGYTSFRPLQQEIIEAVLQEQDVLALLPTGGGKSVCFQVPALAKEGICLVVSPLIALMKDQVDSLKSRGILAAAVYSGMSRRQIVQTLKNVAYGPYKFLYVSPERLETSLFLEYLPAMQVNLIAVDEAHCISQWGYDFRPSYLRIAALREELRDVPLLALTASATSMVQQDICEKLLFTKSTILRQSFERKNLSYSAFKVDAKENKLVQIIKKVPGTAIVYCRSRKRSVQVASLLQMHGIKATAYHAGLPQEQRNERQQAWMNNEMQVIACTNAFGMGIDKPDVRTVVHMDIPESIENYYQEAGRAGRDGKRSYAVLLYNDKDLKELSAAHEQRFPVLNTIKEVYQALVNYLQIPVNSGEDISYTFHFDVFIRKFQLQPQISLSALKALEQDGWIYFNEKSYTPSSVVFTTSKELLYQFEKSYPQHEPLLSALLRTYEGIFDFPAYISEVLLSQLLHKNVEQIRSLLRELTASNILEYIPQNDAPQLLFRKHRVAANDLTLNLQLYNKRKESFVTRAKEIITYAGFEGCRSVFINTYFGDQSAKACGICDYCLQSRKHSISAEEFKVIQNNIVHLLATAPLSISELFLQLKDVPREKARRVVDFLQAEQRISVSDRGELFLN
ncbi:MAG TPA: ATP-dependent DNA helicase RecQ [Chitinophagaceae bacterium]|nr:ATP-dependent DNA helicase RecQ [Chitinophagaceae bacterium]